MAPDKTKIFSFSRFRKWEKTSFEFLGFEFRWGVYGGGRDMVIRRTIPEEVSQCSGRAHRVVQEASSSPSQAVLPHTECQASGLLQLLRGVREFQEFKAVLP